MEFLMTYGWSILIIAVVLGALYVMGVFSGSAFIGNSCMSSSGYLCKNQQLLTDGTLTFNFGQVTGSSLYNMQLACAASAASGVPNPITAFRSIASNGAVLAPSSTGNTLTNGQILTISSLPCYASNGLPLGNPALGTGFSGYVWVNYTLASSAASAASNPWHTAKAITIKTSVV